MRTIPSRPVIHKGIQFRSTQEARWAVFFDRLGIQYQYEVEVPGLYYLPDFFVPTQPEFPEGDIFFEVKPVPNDIEEESCRMLAEMGNKVGILRYMTLTGERDDEKYPEGNGIWFEDGGWDLDHRFCACLHCGAIGFQFEGYGDRIRCCESNKKGGSYLSYGHHKLMIAYKRALTFKWSS
jgi:hypothetical protein